MSLEWFNSKSIEKIVEKNLHLIPNNFDWQFYIEKNSDLAKAGIDNKKSAMAHYLIYGQYEQRIMSKNQLNQLGSSILETDKDFDENFYSEEYPDVKTYFQHLAHIPIRERLFDHYNKFGKIESRFKNKKEKLKQGIDNTSLSSKISIKDFTHKSNKLECICLLLSDRNVSSGDYSLFIKRLLKSTSKKETKNIQFIIVTNKNIPKVELHTTELTSIFSKEVQIVNLDLSPEEDIYFKKTEDNSIKIPPYGAKSGPNILFFRAIKECNKYNTTLCLETDCFFKPQWLPNIIKFVSCSNGFWISGAIYDGKIACKASSCMMTHINGGTSLYATGNNNFQIFLDYAENFVIKRIQEGMPGLAYDYGIKMFIDSNIDNHAHNSQDILLWKLISRQYLPNKLIGNFSIESDRDLKLADIDRIYNYYIIHKKT
jgi:hypothetical protein